MAKKNIDLGKLGSKKKVIKNTSTDDNQLERKALERIHKAKGEGTRRITIDVPTEQHARMKMRVFSLQTTIKDYVLDLVEKDLNSQ